LLKKSVTADPQALKKHDMAKTTKAPRERLNIKRPKVKKGPVEADNAWYDKAYARSSIVLRQPKPEAPLPKPVIPKGRGLNS
jgi:hypothetical protein